MKNCHGFNFLKYPVILVTYILFKFCIFITDIRANNNNKKKKIEHRKNLHNSIKIRKKKNLNQSKKTGKIHKIFKL